MAASLAAPDRDSITRTRARAPGAEGDPPSRAVHHHGQRPGAVRGNRSDPAVHEGRRQTERQQVYAGSRLKPLTFGKAPPDRPAFQPYWGKPAVRNERGDRGNVGIIRSPVRASILPNYLDRAKPSYVGGLLEMANARLYPFWGRLTGALRTGAPQNEAADGRSDPFSAIYSLHPTASPPGFSRDKSPLAAPVFEVSGLRSGSGGPRDRVAVAHTSQDGQRHF